MSKTQKSKPILEIDLDVKEKNREHSLDELRDLVKLGVKSTFNQKGKLEFHPFYKDNYYNINRKLCKHGDNVLKFKIGSSEKPVVFFMAKNESKDSEGKIISGDYEGEKSFIIRFKYPDIIDIFEGLDKLIKKDISSNIKSKIESIRNIKKKKKNITTSELKKTLGDNWYYEDVSIPVLESRLEILESDDSFSLYKPLVKSNPENLSSKSIRTRGRFYHKKYKGTPIYKLNPEKLIATRVNIDTSSDDKIEPFFTKKYTGAVVCYISKILKQSGKAKWGANIEISCVNLFNVYSNNADIPTKYKMEENIDAEDLFK